ncbi:MAG: SufE family protein [Phycisphaeraceae bacterium]|nr:SufE family protein [Phycisphaeraceae bacterium]
MSRFDELIELFQSVDDATRGELLLDYSRRVPGLNDQTIDADELASHRLHECQTPVFLWMSVEGGKMRIRGVVADEAPTVKGFLGVILHGLEDATPEDVQSMPDDLMDRLGLGTMLRMNRAIGLSAMIARIKREAASAASGKDGQI